MTLQHYSVPNKDYQCQGNQGLSMHDQQATSQTKLQRACSTRAAFDESHPVYTTSLSKLYDREIREFFESARLRLHGKDKRLGHYKDSKEKLLNSGSSGEIGKSSSRSSSLTDVRGSDPDLNERQKFDKAIQILQGLIMNEILANLLILHNWSARKNRNREIFLFLLTHSNVSQHRDISEWLEHKQRITIQLGTQVSF
ncbi:uncharacterized protein LOC102806819 [Saccoglossus kowalevskii]|uniref:Uncharacterized protein LOC102806819 n=1 Tax=Saccoglossus kowalevskii TaxID=10224 RepID=A0ABM0M8F2_SACKO|nr:PREDICTED: uncharacterized protein LOC102806819 [Saccoglossus kowalevskii]